MRRFSLFRWIASLMLTMALLPSAVSAQDADALTICGTFSMDSVSDAWNLGDDLDEVYTNGHDHEGTLTLYGLSYSYYHYYDEWDDWSGWRGYHDAYITSVHATSFDFQFSGPDADVLNEVVSRRLARGDSTFGAFLDLWNGEYVDFADPESSGSYSTISIGLRPQDPAIGVRFSVNGYWNRSVLFSTEEYGYPLVEPRLMDAESVITDARTVSSNPGSLWSIDDIVDLGPAPSLPPSLRIADGSVLEGNKDTSRLDLTVTLSRISSDAVTVKYATASGTAVAASDYNASSGTLTFQPGETRRVRT